MTPWAAALQHERESSLHNGDLMVQCMPPGVPRMNMSNGMVHPFKIVPSYGLYLLLYETSANSTFRQVYMDGRPLPRKIPIPRGSVIPWATGKAIRS